MSDALESKGKTLARRIIQQFVAKIMVKDGNLDLRGQVPLTRHFYAFDIHVPQSTESDLRHPDKEQLRSTIVYMRDRGLSYRQIGVQLGIHWTRVGQIVRNVE